MRKSRKATDIDSSAVVKQKLARLSAGEVPRVLDLFSGCGGLSLGFNAAGFKIAASVEMDPDAARSHGLNFHGGSDAHSVARDITKTTAASLARELGLGKPEDAIDIIVGGPPCQAFARVGRSKLREIAEHPEAFRHDPRSQLYIKYLDYVRDCAPLAVVMENVPDMLNFGGHNIAEEVCEVLTSLGYDCGYTLLNAAHYGVPQMRERAFVFALRKELKQAIEFPVPTHWISLPSGYEGTRAVARKLLADPDLFDEESFWHPTPSAAAGTPPSVTARQALQDLPVINARTELASGTLKRGARRFDQTLSYPVVDVTSDYSKLMRNWSGFEAKDGIRDHVIRYLPRDYKLFARLSSGDQYPEAHRMAEAMFAEALALAEQKGCPLVEDSEEWKALKQSIVPPYDHTKFPNKWRKMEADMPARTLMAHLGKDSYSHIHYDSLQARTISVREAARLQSFPDGFVFSGTMNPAFRQIGNAVPPLLAKAIGLTVMSKISAALEVKPARTAAVGE